MGQPKLRDPVVKDRKETRAAKPKLKKVENKEKGKSNDGPLDPAKHKIEPGPGDEIGPGEVDEVGNYLMEELDFLRLQARKERRNNCRAQAKALKTQAELLQLKMAAEVNRFANQAASMERAAAEHDRQIQEQLNELSKKYDIDFKDPTVVVDDEIGKIIATDPTKGLPRISRRE